MRTPLLGLLCLLVLTVSAFLGAQDAGTVKVRLQLRDIETEKPMPGIVQVFVGDAKTPMSLPGLYDRLKGVKSDAGWQVLDPGQTWTAVVEMRFPATQSLAERARP